MMRPGKDIPSEFGENITLNILIFLKVRSSLKIFPRNLYSSKNRSRKYRSQVGQNYFHRRVGFPGFHSGKSLCNVYLLVW